MNELIAKFKLIISEGEQKLKELIDGHNELNKAKADHSDKVFEFEKAKKALEAREAAVSGIENVLGFKSELDKREHGINVREKNVTDQLLRREQLVSQQERDLKKKETELAAMQADIVEQRKKLDEEKKNFKDKILKELAKNA